ncbi:neutral zinc metallopeptidase [Spiractinospora alimapuensis]|uniref:neutral zinc metallopeptidase n=1 Tax=Spiractinospora alimapuensis TaxID=2820884 RepID=UPI001F336AFC|nr:neutral zinc metallopeptidase [Spiractinospora alimapuensis]
MIATVAMATLVWSAVASPAPVRSQGGLEEPPIPDAAADVSLETGWVERQDLPPLDDTDDDASAESDESSDSDEDDDDQPSGWAALTSNPLYETDRLAPRPCPVPDLDIDDPESMEEFLHTLTDCLDESWQTQFDRAGLEFEHPERVFWTEPGTSPCRDYPSPAGAFYCRSSSGIYMGLEDVVDKWNRETNGVVYASLLAHEYAHHVQGEAGILEYYHERRSDEEELSDRNEWTRRSELQANCLAGVFLGAIEVSYPLSEEDREVFLDDAEATADRDGADDERTHGAPENSVLWSERGLTEQTPGACDTWSAEQSLVE